MRTKQGDRIQVERNADKQWADGNGIRSGGGTPRQPHHRPSPTLPIGARRPPHLGRGCLIRLNIICSTFLSSSVFLGIDIQHIDADGRGRWSNGGDL